MSAKELLGVIGQFIHELSIMERIGPIEALVLMGLLGFIRLSFIINNTFKFHLRAPLDPMEPMEPLDII